MKLETMNKRIFQLLLFVLTISLFQSCNTSFEKSEVSELFPNPCDTSDMYYLANFTDKSLIKSIIKKKEVLPNGKERSKGLVAIPQDFDDFRGENLDEIYWKGMKIFWFLAGMRH